MDKNRVVNGTVVAEGTALGIGGVLVRWLLADESTNTELGRTMSDADGSFALTVADTPEARQAECRLQVYPDIPSTLQLSMPDDHPLGEPVPVSRDLREITLTMPVEGAEISPDQWQSLAGYLNSNRMLQTRDLAGQLVSPAPDSPTLTWSPQTRGSVLRDLLAITSEEAQQVADDMRLLYDNSYIETTRLGEGELRGAVDYFRRPQTVAEHLDRFGTLFPHLPQDDLELYRDYLRGVWVTAATRMHGGNPNADLLVRQLYTRFHQDFLTHDTASQPAARLVAVILSSVLTGGPDRGGFSLAPAAIPAQGAQTDEEYLQTLIALSGLSVKELRNRFRISFERLPGETTSPVALNVEALLGLFADTYQSPQEPFNTLPAILDNGKPLLFGEFVGRAPFFLEYEEWLARQRFYPENVYNIRRNIPNFIPDYRTAIDGHSKVEASDHVIEVGQDRGFYASKADRTASTKWLLRLFPIADTLNDALGKLDGEDYHGASDKLGAASNLIRDALAAYDTQWERDRFWWWWSTGVWNKDYRVSLKDRARSKITSIGELQQFEGFFDVPYYPYPTGQIADTLESMEKSLAQARTLYLYNLLYLARVLIPYFRAVIAQNQGDYASSIAQLAPLTGYEVGVAETTRNPGYADSLYLTPDFYHDANLPYTVGVAFDEAATYKDLAPYFHLGSEGALPHESDRMALHPVEQTFFKLAQADAMLAWADELYRNDDPSSIRRARELYKGVILMYGADPEIAPDFPRDGALRWKPSFDVQFGNLLNWKSQENPAKAAQLLRARLAFYQIERGLNAYGYRQDMVPLLRYRPLKLSADLFAASAKSAQSDFLAYTGKYEQAQLDRMNVQVLVKKAQASVGIAAERIAIAQAGVDKAQEQVQAVQAQIAAKKAEIADSDSFFNQVSDFFGGMKDTLTGMVPLAQKVMADDSAAGAVTGEDLLGILKAYGSGGGSAAETAAEATLGSGAGLAIGFGTFAYVGYKTMSSMADAYAQRASDLKTLQEVALPAAQAQVRLRERDVSIARYESQIAEADLEYARELLRFQQDRFLNVDFWRKLAGFANRLMRRYVELGARTGCLAERALAFEQNRAIDIIRMNYLPRDLRGVTGADRLQMDLAELEANRIQGIRLSTPVKHTISLAREFPVQFGQIKRTGRCRFRTTEAPLQIAYPGTFGYRIRALTVAAYNPDGLPPRGILRNGGISSVWREDLSGADRLARFADALPLSEFRLHDDLFVYGLPGETLLQFEGSGFETDWELEFPAAANPSGLRSVADVLITFDMNAGYSHTLAARLAAAPPPPVTRAILLPASVWDPRGLGSLKQAASATAHLTFDPRRVALPAQEKARTIAQVALVLVGATPSDYAATLAAPDAGLQAAFTIHTGFALSNDGALLGGAAPAPLNAFVGQPVDQLLTLDVDKAGFEDELGKLYDIVLYIEYTANL